MGRVARYKKVKKSLSKATPNGAERISINNNGKDSKGSIDYFDRVGVWGLGDSGRKPKKRSLASLKLRAQRNKKLPDIKETYDLGCAEGDDFDMKDLVGSLKKELQPAEVAEFTSTIHTLTSTTSSLNPAQNLPTDTISSVPSTRNELSTPSQALTFTENSSTVISTMESKLIATEDEKLHKKFEAQVVPKKSTIVKSDGRMVGESKNAYSKRVKQETRQIIQRANQQAHNPEKRLKKKEFLTLKKKNGTSKKRKNKFVNNDDNDDAFQLDDDNDYNNIGKSDRLLTGEQAVAARERATRVQFGEQAERPPNFTQLPRGAIDLKNKKKQKMSLSSSSTSFKTQQDIDTEAFAMDLIRKKVQAQYAEIKARRRNNGDFHL